MTAITFAKYPTVIRLMILVATWWRQMTGRHGKKDVPLRLEEVKRLGGIDTVSQPVPRDKSDIRRTG